MHLDHWTLVLDLDLVLDLLDQLCTDSQITWRVVDRKRFRKSISMVCLYYQKSRPLLTTSQHDLQLWGSLEFFGGL